MFVNKLKMDLIDLRLKNVVIEGEIIFVYGKILNSVDLIKCINKGKEFIGWNEKYFCKYFDNGKIRSVGMVIIM